MNGLPAKTTPPRPKRWNSQLEANARAVLVEAYLLLLDRDWSPAVASRFIGVPRSTLAALTEKFLQGGTQALIPQTRPDPDSALSRAIAPIKRGWRLALFGKEIGL